MIEALSLTDFDLSSTLGTQSVRTQAVQGTQAIAGSGAVAGSAANRLENRKSVV